MATRTVWRGKTYVLRVGARAARLPTGPETPAFAEPTNDDAAAFAQTVSVGRRTAHYLVTPRAARR